jgi:hypothetical protein
MTPLPSEIIAGVRRILEETIAPELTSGHARSRLHDIRAVLAQVNWDDAGFVLAERCRRISAALAAIEAWRASDATRAQALPPVSADFPAEPSMAAYSEAYRGLAAAAVALVDPLTDWLAAHPDEREAKALYQSLLEAL